MLIRTKHSQSTLLKISKAIFSAQLTKNYLHEIKFTEYFRKKLKFTLNRVIDELELVESKEFSIAYEKVDDETFELSELKQDLIEEIVNLGPGHYKMLTNIIKDYKVKYEELVEQEKQKNETNNI